MGMNDDGDGSNDQDNDVQKSNNEIILRRFFQIILFKLVDIDDYYDRLVNFKSVLPSCFSGHG